MGDVKVTVAVMAKNEERRIRDCLESVKWADEIIVVDDESTDSTVAIAKEYTPKVIIKKMEIEGKHRNWMYQQAKNDWVLSIDADERASRSMEFEIRKTLSTGTEYTAFTFPRKNYIGDYWIKGGGLYPSPQLKMLRKDKFKWEEAEVHPRAFLEGQCGHMKSDIIHFTYRDWEDFLGKLNRQTTLEAKKWHKLSFERPFKVKYKMNTVHVYKRAADRFLDTFFLKKGFKDGIVGFMIAYFASVYQMVSFAKFRELQAKGRKK